MKREAAKPPGDFTHGLLLYDRATGIIFSSSFSEEGTALVRVHKLLLAEGIMMEPKPTFRGGLPTGGHVTTFVVVGASVLIVGWIVGSEFVFFVGEKVGRGVGAEVVL